MDPESMQEVRLYAPQAFRRQERAVTPEDYASIAGRHPQVQRAQASLRWTGSWHTVFVTIDRSGGRAVDDTFKHELLDFLEPFRLAGHDLEINSPETVPLDVALAVCVKAGYFQADVRRGLLERLGSRELRGGMRGFFHPDNFSFGQPVYLSQVITAALSVAGVDTVEALRFQRWGKAANQELQNAEITFGALEIARLDNDPNFPENGQLSLTLKGGL
jgi:predicted phage baseplate assembly protein